MPAKIMLEWMNTNDLSISEIDLLMYVRCRTKYLHDCKNIKQSVSSLEQSVTSENVTNSRHTSYFLLNRLLRNLVSLENISQIIQTNYSEKNIFLNDSELNCSTPMLCFTKNRYYINNVSFPAKQPTFFQSILNIYEDILKNKTVIFFSVCVFGLFTCCMCCVFCRYPKKKNKVSISDVLYTKMIDGEHV